MDVDLLRVYLKVSFPSAKPEEDALKWSVSAQTRSRPLQDGQDLCQKQKVSTITKEVSRDSAEQVRTRAFPATVNRSSARASLPAFWAGSALNPDKLGGGLGVAWTLWLEY